MTFQYPRIPILAYSDRLSARPGEQVAFKVSSDGPDPYEVRVTRSISADPNPAGQGIVEWDVDSEIAGTYPSRRQGFNPGSHVWIAEGPEVSGDIELTARVWPSRPGGAEQVIMSACGAELLLDADGAAALRIGGRTLSTGEPLLERYWYTLHTSVSADGTAVLTQTPRDLWQTQRSASGSLPPPPRGTAPSVIAAGLDDGHPSRHFNGKIEAPTIHSGGTVVAAWDFSRDTMSTRVVDTGPSALHGTLVNHGARAMVGFDWDGSEMCWRHKPEHYAAIHFHDDDIYDFGWETDLTWILPDDLASGIYVVRFRYGDHEDAVPVFVCPPRGKRTARLAVLVSTFTYTVYGNNARIDYDPSWLDRIEEWGAYPWNAAEYRELGMSTYNYHTDGSGICHASHLRPLLTIRPGYITYGYGDGSGLRHFQADSHLIAWLHRQGIDYDIVTDVELHHEGASVLEGYAAVTTGSHPEYHTKETLDALETYRNEGGNLCYLGGNGFYWRVALHRENDGVIEIRRAEGGIRAWAAEPGEYFNAFDGAYGGLWRRNGRPPQLLGGVGFTAQGQFEGSYYRRRPESYGPEFAWLFDGIQDDVIGDFGFSGGGAAGFELDRAEPRLGTPPGTSVLASSEEHTESFILVHEEQLTHLANWAQESEDKLLRADMVFFEVPGGGAVFSTGSITFCGSLPWNEFDNNVSRLLENVMQRFLST